MSYVFGPVPSRRLGRSLGIDLIPMKSCTYDCLYCQVGRTTSKIISPAAFVPVHAVIEELESVLPDCEPDVITLSGSGEPTLELALDRVISSIKEISRVPVALLTNGSLFWKEELRERALLADLILPTVTTAFDETFQRIHRPHRDLKLASVLEGLTALREAFCGLLAVEVMLLQGINDTEKELEGLKAILDRIRPEKIHLNTIARPPADVRARPLDTKRLEAIRVFFGRNAEIVAGAPSSSKGRVGGPVDFALLETIRRRPLRPTDMAHTLNLPLEQVERIVKRLIEDGRLREQEHEGESYFMATDGGGYDGAGRRE